MPAPVTLTSEATPLLATSEPSPLFTATTTVASSIVETSSTIQHPYSVSTTSGTSTPQVSPDQVILTPTQPASYATTPPQPQFYTTPGSVDTTAATTSPQFYTPPILSIPTQQPPASIASPVVAPYSYYPNQQMQQMQQTASVPSATVQPATYTIPYQPMLTPAFSPVAPPPATIVQTNVQPPSQAQLSDVQNANFLSSYFSNGGKSEDFNQVISNAGMENNFQA